MNKFETFTAILKQHYSFAIKYKDESLFMKIIGYIFFFNKKFMTNFSTTIGNTIYFPSKKYIEQNDVVAINILAHELVHIKQKEQYGFLFYLGYLFPQVLFPLSFLFFLSPYFLLFLIFLLPLPAIFRKNFEYEAYLMSMYVLNLYLKLSNCSDFDLNTFLNNRAKYINTKFTGLDYWIMWPFGTSFEKTITTIKSDDISKESDLYAVINTAYKQIF